MTWFIWRQHRWQGLWVLLATAAVVTAMLWTAAHASDAMSALGACGSRSHSGRHGAPGVTCSQDTVDSFARSYGFTIPAFEMGVPLLLALIGALTGAPLVAREIEQRTHLVAWAQSVTRRRWYTAKTLAIGATLTAMGLLAGFAADRLQRPLTDGGVISSRWIWFYAVGLAPSGIALLAFALAVAAGARLRRTLPAVGIALAATLVLVLLAGQAVRTWTPVTQPTGPRFGSPPLGAWAVSGGTYHPSSQFWPLQLTFLAILIALAAGLLALGWRATKTRAV
jgi:hypothetical protein